MSTKDDPMMDFHCYENFDEMGKTSRRRKAKSSATTTTRTERAKLRSDTRVACPSLKKNPVEKPAREARTGSTVRKRTRTPRDPAYHDVRALLALSADDWDWMPSLFDVEGRLIHHPDSAL